MKESIVSIIDQTVAANPSLEERLRAFEDAYASVPEEKRPFYRFVFWMIATMRDTGIHISTSPSATVRTRKQIAYAARLQLRHFCSVLGFSPRNLAKTAEHLDKFLAWFRARNIAVPKDDARSLLGLVLRRKATSLRVNRLLMQLDHRLITLPRGLRQPQPPSALLRSKPLLLPVDFLQCLFIGHDSYSCSTV